MIATGSHLTGSASKAFLEAGKKRLLGDTELQATSGDATGMSGVIVETPQLAEDACLAERDARLDALIPKCFTARSAISLQDGMESR